MTAAALRFSCVIPLLIVIRCVSTEGVVAGSDLLQDRSADTAVDRSDRPLDVQLEEQIDVQLVLLDTVVLDRKDRTVSDLTVDEFLVLIDGKPVRPSSLDVSCAAGSTPDPRAGQRLPALPETDTAPPPRRIVLVFDYYHMDWATESLSYAQRAMDELAVGGEEHMVIALGEVLSIQQWFTPDPEKVKQALEKMRTDERLFAGNYGRLTERRFFRRVEALFDLLEQLPGRKTVVLFSGPFLDDGFFYDGAIKSMGARSARARAAVYPVDSGGMRTLGDPGDTGTSGPELLRRLANETGGRMTANTNDLNLAYARAQRDMGCTYTLGFYDRSPRLDKNRRVTIRVERSGHHAIYPQYYVIRSRERQRRSLIRTATMAPGIFEDAGLTANTFVIRPDSARRWESVVAIRIDLDAAHLRPDTQEWDLRAVIRKPWGTLVDSFRQTVALPSSESASGLREPVALFENTKLKPGRYSLNVVLAHPDADSPLTTTVEIEVPEIPLERWFVVGPIVGTASAAEPDAKSRDAVARHGFEPFLANSTSAGTPVASLIHVCHISDVIEPPERDLRRVVRESDGTIVQSFGPTPIGLEGKKRVRCERVLDRLSDDRYGPGEYSIRAMTESDRLIDVGRARFTVLPPG